MKHWKPLGAAAGAAVVTIVMLVVTASPAFAHATLDSTSPEAGGRVASSPPNVLLQFSEPVTFESNAVQVFDANGKTVNSGKPKHGTKSSQVTVTLPQLKDGVYAVTWRVISADTHPVQGAFTFAVGNAVVSAANNNLAQQLLAKRASRDTTVSVAYAIDRFLVFTSLGLLVGMTAFVVALWPEGFSSKRIRNAIWTSWAVAIASTVIAVFLQAAYATGGSVSNAFNGSAISDTLHARAGEAWVVRVVLLVLSWLLLRALMRDPRQPALRVVAGIAAVAVLATPAFSGHASTGRWVAFSVPLDALHLIAMSVWFGGLAVLALAFLRTDDVDAVEGTMARFSQLAMTAVIVLIVTGTFQVLRQVPHFSELLSTTYGRLLLIKLAAFGAVLIVAAGSRSIVKYEIRADGRELVREPLPVGPGAKLADEFEPPDPADTMSRLRSAVWFEIIFMVVVLGVTALLVNAAPAGAAGAAKPYFVTLKSDDLRVWFEIEVTPAKVGPNQVHVTVENPNGIVIPILDLKVSLAEPSKGVAPINVTMIRLGTGHYASVNATIPFPGTWQIEAKALITPVVEESVIGVFKVGK
jgi:copper transport protein